MKDLDNRLYFNSKNYRNMEKCNLTPNEGYKDLEGMEVVETRRCDECEFSNLDCKKLILAEGKHVCVI